MNFRCSTTRVPGRRDRCLPKWYGRGIPVRYAGLPLEGEVYHPGRPIILHISLIYGFNDSIIISIIHILPIITI